MTKYYAGGALKFENGVLYLRETCGYVYDFFNDGYDLFKPELECTREEALAEYIRIFGTDEGFENNKK